MKDGQVFKLFTVRIDEELHEKLRLDSFQNKISMNQIINKLLEEKYNKTDD